MENKTVEDNLMVDTTDDAGSSSALASSNTRHHRERQHNNQRRRPARNEGDRDRYPPNPPRRVPLSPQESPNSSLGNRLSNHSQQQGRGRGNENYSRPYHQHNQHPRNNYRGRGRGGGWGSYHSQGYTSTEAQQGEVDWQRNDEGNDASVANTTSFSNHHNRQQRHQSYNYSDNRGNRRGRGNYNQRRAPRESNDRRGEDIDNRDEYRHHRENRGNTHRDDHYQNRYFHHDDRVNDSTSINSSNSTTLLNLNPNAPAFEPSNTDTAGKATVETKSSNFYGSPKRRTQNRQNFDDDFERVTDGIQESRKDKPRNQREVLIDQLSRNNHECMVCCEKVRYSQPIWSCQRCFNVFHLSCIRKWVAKSDDESGWRCPSCQSCHDNAPDGYYCFCGKTKNPKSSRYDVPHTCGQVCGKMKPGGINCTHSCNSQCHPGPCPTCQVQQVRFCGCGQTNAQVLCGSKTILSCERVCNKLLSCGAHHCSRKCHQGDCAPCEEIIKHECYCGRNTKQVECTLSSNKCKFYCCSTLCNKQLTCGHHTCDDPCHPGSCSPCKTSPGAVISCPCGQTGISEACKIAKIRERTRCIDPIPTCGKKCLKILSCGGDGDGVNNGKHHCQEKCHLSKECPPCKLVSDVKCRCGSKSIQIPCNQLKASLEQGITCNKKCNRKRSCGKHKCNSSCCIDLDHICPIVCQRPLRCGIHKCSRLCHLNPCPPCELASFDELSCECGASIIYPPVPCGTKRPPCLLPCSRQHACNHPVHHPCHSESNCPPCTVLTEKWCHGLHEKRKNVMCHIAHLSCGMPCRKPLSCKRHTCPKVCHSGLCLDDGEICKLACSQPRTCGHQCGAPCHNGQCPESKCKITTDVNCPCGRRADTLVCWKRENEYDRTVTWEYHKELKRLDEEMTKAKKEGKVIVISEEMKAELMTTFREKIAKSQVLECDKECAKLERNRKLAEALQLEYVDTTTTSIGTPNYSEYLIKFAKKNPQFVESVHKQLTDLVLKAKQSTKKNLTYGFNSMNRDKRHVIHEYSDHFGMLSESFDEEPNRNVVCFASKEKSYLPTVSLIDAVFRPPAVRSERLKPNDDVTFRPEKRTQVVGPSNWGMPKAKSASQSEMVMLNTPGSSADFPPL